MNMYPVLIATVTVAVIGFVMGMLLITVGKKFKVEVDEKELAVREYLPGNNCGACGYAGCDAMAAAIAKGEAPVNGCPVGGEPVAEKISQIMGVSAEAQEKKVAYVKCLGSCEHTANRSNYIGIHDCAAAVSSGLSPWECDYGCLGFGSCVQACQFGGIRIQNGVAVIDRTMCKGCGQCVTACPKHLIELIPAKASYAVRCSNKERGPVVKKSCDVGCIGCKLCVKQCEHDAITVENNIAHIDYDKCVGCGKCAEKCPSKAIEML
ncbi:MAG: RnfABCDGE type electron transport complex subunit B [Lachnospiraceae bacterium]|nr:RnfABCDGE type electron transport complex subunit B [Lachnospiraceae bacterium]